MWFEIIIATIGLYLFLWRIGTWNSKDTKHNTPSVKETWNVEGQHFD